MSVVSHETSAAPDAKRRYRSPALTAKAARTKQRLIDAALAFIAKGNFRPTVLEITQAAGTHGGAVTYHFGGLELMMRVIAREHLDEIKLPFADGFMLDHEFRDAVWVVLVGRPRELS